MGSSLGERVNLSKRFFGISSWKIITSRNVRTQRQHIALCAVKITVHMSIWGKVISFNSLLNHDIIRSRTKLLAYFCGIC